MDDSDGDGSENVTFEMLLLFYTFSCVFYFIFFFHFAENVKRRRISVELISWGPHSSLERERKIRSRPFESSTEREIKHFYVVIVQ